MARQDLIAAIRNALERGESVEDAKKSLVNAGYRISEVDEAAIEIEKLKLGMRAPKAKNNKFPPLPSPPKL